MTSIKFKTLSILRSFKLKRKEMIPKYTLDLDNNSEEKNNKIEEIYYVKHNKNVNLRSGHKLSKPSSTKSSCGPDPTSEMISRRRILSRSRDELNFADQYNYEDEEDVWYTKDKLFKDHIQEILNKWDQIDDEIWAKIICMERNRRVAKAYARAPVLTVSGSDDGFDGYRIGLNGFDNPMRDPKTDVVKRHIGDGVKIRMDDSGNILIKRLAKSNIYIKCWQNDGNPDTTTSVSNDIIRLNGLLEYNKAVRLFDMKKFQSNVSRELRRAYPDRRKLESQCVCCIAFVKDASDVLDLPVWVMVINIVAMDMLKSKLPPTISKRQSVPNLVSLFDRQKQAMTDEDPYSLPGNNSSSSGSRSSSGHYASTGVLANQKSPSEPKPPKLPPRDFERNRDKGKNKNKNKNSTQPKPDYQEENIYSLGQNPRQFDDPYYSGFSARVPNYAKRSSMPMSSHAQQSKQYDYHMRKVPSSGFLNSYLKTAPHHSRSTSYQSFYGSLESDPYTGSSADGGNTDDNAYDPTYGRIGSAHRQYQGQHFGAKRSSASMPWAYNSREGTYYGEWDE